MCHGEHLGLSSRLPAHLLKGMGGTSIVGGCPQVWCPQSRKSEHQVRSNLTGIYGRQVPAGLTVSIESGLARSGCKDNKADSHLRQNVLHTHAALGRIANPHMTTSNNASLQSIVGKTAQTSQIATSELPRRASRPT